MHCTLIPDHILQTIEIEGYYKVFNIYFALHGVQKKAWEIIEEEREAVGIPARYSSFESFRSAKHQYKKRKQGRKEDPMQIRLF